MHTTQNTGSQPQHFSVAQARYTCEWFPRPHQKPYETIKRVIVGPSFNALFLQPAQDSTEWGAYGLWIGEPLEDQPKWTLCFHVPSGTNDLSW